jgi:hypothetical protein
MSWPVRRQRDSVSELASRRVCGRGTLGRRGGGLVVMGGDDAREGSKQPAKGAFGQSAL